MISNHQFEQWEMGLRTNKLSSETHSGCWQNTKISCWAPFLTVHLSNWKLLFATELHKCVFSEGGTEIKRSLIGTRTNKIPTKSPQSSTCIFKAVDLLKQPFLVNKVKTFCERVCACVSWIMKRIFNNTQTYWMFSRRCQRVCLM